MVAAKGFRRGLAAFSEALFPSNIYCICCKEPIKPWEPYSLCEGCRRHLFWANGKTCRCCGRRIDDDSLKEICSTCNNRELTGEEPYAFDKGFICVEYGMYEKIIVQKYKYGGQAYLGDKLGDIMRDRIIIEEEGVFDLIVPVPLHRKKQGKRGYNQAELMAKKLGKNLDLPVCCDNLIRRKNTAPMSKKTPEERRENAKGAFGIKRAAEFQGKTVLLVDDIFTTGSTADECSRVLKEEGGARSVILLCFAGGADIKLDREILEDGVMEQ